MKGKLKIGIKGRLERNVFYSPGGCWLWLGSKRPEKHGGYGIVKIDRKWSRAHRVSYEAYKGQIPDGLFVCHTCDTPLCINPHHLFLGTLQDNNLDMYRKGRNYSSSGDSNPKSKLTESDIPRIIELRKSGKYFREIASLYEVSDNAIRSIFTGRTWSHLQLLT